MLPVPSNGAQRASSQSIGPVRSSSPSRSRWRPPSGSRTRSRRGGAGIKVVVIVGPGRLEHRELHRQREDATPRRPARTARPWSRSTARTRRGRRVKAAAQGAKVVIYLGHGNGSPSPYGAFSPYTKDGFGLNAIGRARQQQHEVLRRVLHRHADQAGAERRRHPQPTVLRVGQLRVGLGQPDQDRRQAACRQLRAAASCVPTRGRSSPTGSRARRTSCTACSRRTGRSGRSSRARPNWGGAYDFQFQSTRNPAYRDWMEPKSPGRYYRSVVGNSRADRGDVPRELTRASSTDRVETRRPRSGIVVPAGADVCVGVDAGSGRRDAATIPSIARIVIRTTSRAGHGAALVGSRGSSIWVVIGRDSVPDSWSALAHPASR